MSKEESYKQDGNKENTQNLENQRLEARKEMYKNAPGLYKEWGMKVVNEAIENLKDEYPKLKSLGYQYKQVWVEGLVEILMQQTTEPANPITEEQLQVGKDRLLGFVERKIRKFLGGEQALDELLWEQELKDKNN